MLLLFSSAFAQDRPEETEQQKRMAKMMDESMDYLWDQAAEDGMGNIQILITKDGEPFSLPASYLRKIHLRC